MPSGLDDLARRMNLYGTTVLKNINRKTRRTALAIDTELVKAMPVDTGRARSAVVVTVGEPSLVETKEAYYPGKKGSTKGQNLRAATAQARAAIEPRNIGEEIHININIPYIDRLNEGYSKLADPGFIEDAIEAGIESQRDLPIL